MTSMAHVYKWIDSPVDRLKLVARDDGLAAILWKADHRRYRHLEDLIEDPAHPVLIETERQLRDYFAGTRKTFDLPLAFAGTDFQKSVWAALLTIPYGEIRSYADVARQIGKPKAMRAVGAANGMNPISIVAPCHRVLGASGALTGFAGGLAAKTYLLRLEGAKTQARLLDAPALPSDLWAAADRMV